MIVSANWYRFRSGERIRHEVVASVAFVWVVTGAGLIRAGSQDFRMTSGTVLRLPWRHSVDYRPDDRSPFSVGTIHVVPWHDEAVPVEPRVAYVPGEALLDAPFRRAAAPGEGSGSAEPPILMSARSTSGRGLISLATYAVERFVRHEFDEATYRSLGGLVMQESAAWSHAPEQAGAPAVLELMTDHIVSHLSSPVTVAEVAEAGGCSPATAERLFARYTGLSVLAWARRVRMDEAARLLRTTGLRASEVARAVGYTDPLYFSRVFRQTFSVPPSRYAAGQLRP
ncbi:AraC-like DNA-binding protein [Frondihabitans australicus]|uniref:AraC-like DNA-binding protein n=1 Tax=Frondihabitans australicus TaxID=386892 RepID=A0A495IEZ8_9MICO|nr:AraC-like DNA-binding protein [Frondihabitans australicus]